MTSISKLMLTAAKYTGLFHWAEWATRHRLRVLSYAGFGDMAAPPGGISLKSFGARASWLHHSCYPVLSLDEAAGCMARNDLPPNATVIVIDPAARPDSEGVMAILGHYHFPASFEKLGQGHGLKVSGGQRLASNPGFKSEGTSGGKPIWIDDREELQSIEFEAEMSGFLDICRALAKNPLRRQQEG